MQMAPTMGNASSRTVYLGNIPPETSAEEILGHVRSGQIESVRLLPDKNCAFISFLDGSSATHFHSDAILKKLAIRGQDIKVGWGKPAQVPTSVSVAVQQSGASRNVYLGNLPETVTEAELRDDLATLSKLSRSCPKNRNGRPLAVSTTARIDVLMSQRRNSRMLLSTLGSPPAMHIC